MGDETFDRNGCANSRLNYPVLFSATAGAGSTTVTGQLDTLPNLGVTIDFYSSDAPDPSGHGEGQRYISSHSFTSPPAGPGAFTVTLHVAVTTSEIITATTVDEFGNTSEFSHFIQMTETPKTCLDTPANLVSW